jgi:hypothetical protein
MRSLLVLLAACQPVSKGDTAGSSAPDDDLDGYGEDVDCADDDPDVNPGADEICDGVDNNCDGLVDEGVTTDFLPDADGDGFADPEAAPLAACERPEGHLPASAANDCDDTDPLTHPGANEYCDGIDNDCDGQADPTSCRPLESSDVVIRGEDAGHRLGTLVAAVGDLTGDGTPDILLGAPEAEPAGNSSGLAYILAGPVATTATIADAVGTIAGDSLGDRVGTSAGGEHDFDGDGQVDVVLGGWGDPTYGAEAGSALVYLGPIAGDLDPEDAAFEVLGSNAGDSAGLAVAMLGDMTGDGRSELAVGAPNVDTDGGTLINAGAVYVFTGGSGGSVQTRDAPGVIAGEAAGAYLGQALSAAGDTDGDGLADLLVAAPNATDGGAEAGRVALFLGPVTGGLTLSAADAALDGEAAGDHAGGAVAPAGDLDGDGYDDVLIGAPDQSDGGTGAGAAYVVHGPLSGQASLSAADGVIIGRLAWDHAGNSVAAVGDATGDGISDVLIGAYIEDSGGLNAGAAFMVSGPVTGTRYLTDADAGFIGEAESDLAGWSVAAPGDVNGNGRADVLVGAPQSDVAGTDAGAAYLLYAEAL